jgi:hypothetical protein
MLRVAKGVQLQRKIREAVENHTRIGAHACKQRVRLMQWRNIDHIR